MINSMTGFGHYEVVDGSRRAVVEIKSVNHRYLDLTIKTSRRITSLEPKFRSFLKKNIGRGKVDAYVHFEESADETFSIHYNEKLARGYVENMKRMAEEFGLDYDVSVSTLASYPDVFELVREEEDESELEEFIRPALEGALERFFESRRLEGANLRSDLLEKLEECSELVAQVEELAPTIIEEYKARLTQKVYELLEEKKVDESRIAAEVTIYADKICVDEELVRLKSHVKEMIEALSAKESVGRKMDFLAQEMNREANTILSKSTDAKVAALGISLKTLIEKIREQVQNIE
ncbi:MAG: YicC family protein [Lachnospiraceae bacterium]|nr:YicC family protein [Lachnospiraceae bacterium]